jgi:acyl-CoA dehydrogenase
VPLDFSFSKEQEMWRASVRDFGQSTIKPIVRQMDHEGKIPPEVIKGMADLGLLACTVPEEYGGMGASWMEATIAAEELGRADISVAVPVLYLVMASWGSVLARYANEELKRTILPQVCKAQSFLGIAATEPGGGSDILGATRCKAERQGDGWILNGEKMYISGVAESRAMGGIHMTLVRTDPQAGHKGFTFFAVPLKGTPGISTTLIEDMGRAGISTGGFTMEDVRLPDSYRIGEVGRGFYYAMEGFSAARALIGATCVGAAQAVLDMGIDYIKQRHAFGRPLAAFEGIQFPLAEHAANIEEARLLTYEAAWMMDRMGQDKAAAKDVARIAAMAKLRAPVYAWQAMNEVADWFGAAGYSKEFPIEMGIRGIRSYSIGAEGAMNIMRLIIAREILGAEFLPYRWGAQEA